MSAIKAGVVAEARAQAVTCTSATPETFRNAELCRNFARVLTEGVVLKLYDAGRGGDEAIVRLWLDDETSLAWFDLDGPRAPHLVPIGDITGVDIGKRTPTFALGDAVFAHESLCFSVLLREGRSIDLAASAKMERSALVEGFSMILHQMTSWNGKQDGDGG